ncbi:thymidine kinase [Tessaracoccus sp.]
MSAILRWHYAPMGSGKSTLALQIDHNFRAAGVTGLLFTSLDRSGNPVISSRLGMSREAIEVLPGLDLFDVVRAHQRVQSVSYVIADEAQFYSPAQVEQLARCVDVLNIDVSAFGIATDFRSIMFPGSQRMFEIADEHLAVQAPALCWCGQTARMNARLVNDLMVTDGDQVVVGNTDDDHEAEVRYLLLCRPHFLARQTNPYCSLETVRAA